MTLKFPVADRNTVDLKLPTFTLDVNQIPVRPPAQRTPGLRGLGSLEWNYFECHTVELCVTPEAQVEIIFLFTFDMSPSLSRVARNVSWPQKASTRKHTSEGFDPPISGV